ncbi:MAG: insulinase family protein [Desulfuromonas sp.]|uniref:M16 family metallopeptidase n=1 Tax=Desulfuromonas sp. TaxID=892 RepID=UPI000CC88DA1|nr:pitrilysin family protein [Desulfuromonas sp.]PLX82811.1 MAG: insulinase family protein [Desulfuromonas sp.]
MHHRFVGRSLTALLLTLLLAPGALAQYLEEKVREHTLANGLKLLTVERHDSPTFAAYITIGVGGVDETSQTRGVAHLLEHMLFKGTKTLGTVDFRKEKPLLQEIEEVGVALDTLREARDADPQEVSRLKDRLEALQKRHKEFVVKDEFSRIYAKNGGVGYNAFTSKDLTTYLVSLPANKFELWAAVESDRMKNPVLREFYTEREVITEERRRSYESSPGGMLYETLIANAFTVHPYRNPTIGWPSDIVNLSLAETRDFLHSYYAPVNTVIAIVGDIDTEEAVATVERNFGDIPPGTPVPPVVAVEPEQKGEKRVKVEFDAEPRLAVAFHKPTLPERDDYVFDLIDLILAGGRTSRLYRALVVEQQLATSVSTYGAPGSRFPNLFVFSLVPRYPHTPGEVERALYAELQRLASEPVTPRELERARNRLRTDRLRYLKGNTGLARMLTYYQTVAKDWRYLVDYDEVVAGIGADEVMAAARTYFTPANRTVVTLAKKGQQP